MSDQSNSKEMSGNANHIMMDEIKLMRENMKILLDQITNQSKVVQNLREKVNHLKQEESSPEILESSVETTGPAINPASTPVSINIEDFKPPKTLTILGSVPHDAIQFSVSLEDSRSGNSMLHINPRYNSGSLPDQTAVRTDFRIGLAGGWGPEETHGGNPFLPSKPFSLEIQCQEHCYMILVNKSFWTSFGHRQSFDLINQLTFKGQVNVSEYSIK